MQLNLHIETPTQTKKSWAFAIDRSRVRLGSRRKSRTTTKPNLKHCIITACSREAKALGVRAGMRYDEAKARIPGLKILVCNW